MILINRVRDFNVPHTSSCIIKTKGRIYDGDSVSIISPSFSSFDLKTDARISSSEFEMPIRITNQNGYIDSDGNMEATLVSDDDDTTDLYVRLY